jgi:hypothetical protein
MRRLQLIELQDSDRFPAAWRDMLTDYMNRGTALVSSYDSIVAPLRRVLDSLGCRELVDLGSGGAGPWMEIHKSLNAGASVPIQVTLTDKFPNKNARRKVEQAGVASLRYLATPVDATAVEGMNGCFRTMFSSFHHFPPERARMILADAVDKGVGIGIFESTERSPIGILAQFAAPLVMLVITPFIRPFSWSRILWTYLPPAMPLVILWDGLVSALRTYSVDELRQMAASVDHHDTFQWEVFHFRKPGAHGTALLGYPKEQEGARPQEGR